MLPVPTLIQLLPALTLRFCSTSLDSRGLSALELAASSGGRSGRCRGFPSRWRHSSIMRQQRLALGLPVVERQPFDAVADDHRRQADLQVLGERVEVLVGQHHAAVGGLGRARKGVGGRAVQPDAMAVAALALVPFVGVVDREGAAAVEVGQLLPRQAGGDVIDADRASSCRLRLTFRRRACRA